MDILSLDNIFMEIDIAQRMILKGGRKGTIHNFATDVDLGYKYIGNFRGGISWYC